MAQKTTVQPSSDAQVSPDKMVLEVFGWVQRNVSPPRIKAYLAAKDWTPGMIVTACSKVEEAVRIQSQQLDDQSRQVEFSLRLEKDTYTGALEREQRLQEQAEELAAAAKRVSVFFRPKTEEPAVTQPTSVPLTQRVVQATVGFFKESAPELQLPPIAEVQLPNPDDVYQGIPAILDEEDPSVETTLEWDAIRELAESPEQELANLGQTYADLLPYWQHAQLMGERQAEQSKGIVTTIQAHWARVQEASKQQKATIEKQLENLAAFKNACEKVREAIQAVQAL